MLHPAATPRNPECKAARVNKEGLCTKHAGSQDLTELWSKFEKKQDVVSKVLRETKTFAQTQSGGNRTRRVSLRRASIASKESTRKACASEGEEIHRCPENELSQALLLGANKLRRYEYSGGLPESMELCGEAFRGVAELKGTLRNDVLVKCVEPLEALINHGAAAVQLQKRRVSARRRDYESKRPRRLLVTGNGVMESVVAQEKLAECVSQAKAEMQDVVDCAEEIETLVSFIDALVDFHDNALHLMETANNAVQDQLAELTLQKARQAKISRGVQSRRRRSEVEARVADKAKQRELLTITSAISQQRSCQARAVYDFVAETSTELNVAEGEQITVVAQVDENWVVGERDGVQGHVPISYIALISEEPI